MKLTTQKYQLTSPDYRLIRLMFDFGWSLPKMGEIMELDTITIHNIITRKHFDYTRTTNHSFI